MAYNKKDISFFNEASDDWQDNYVCDIRELNMPYGIYEIFKYCFKDIDIKNIEIFKCLVLGLRNKRIRQGYGLFYNIKVDDRDLDDDELASKDDIRNYLNYKDEVPVIVANNFKDNFEKDRDIRRFRFMIKRKKVYNNK